VINEFSAAENGIVMFASSTGREVSIERDEWRNGRSDQPCISFEKTPC
jgi:hypothetical protein